MPKNRLSAADRCAECRDLALSPEPLTEAHKDEHRCLVAREMARAEARRAPHPQDSLPGMR